jgi:hypothetical protein
MQSRTASIHTTPQSVQLVHHLQHICSSDRNRLRHKKKSWHRLSPKIGFSPHFETGACAEWTGAERQPESKSDAGARGRPDHHPGPGSLCTRSALHRSNALLLCYEQVRDFVFPRKNGQLRGATSQQPERARKRPGFDVCENLREEPLHRESLMSSFPVEEFCQAFQIFRTLGGPWSLLFHDTLRDRPALPLDGDRAGRAWITETGF